MPELVVKGISIEEVKSVMKYAYENNIPIIARGLGTGLVGTCVPLMGGIVIDLSGMDRILERDEVNLTLTLEPGVLLMEIGKFVQLNMDKFLLNIIHIL